MFKSKKYDNVIPFSTVQKMFPELSAAILKGILRECSDQIHVFFSFFFFFFFFFFF